MAPQAIVINKNGIIGGASIGILFATAGADANKSALPVTPAITNPRMSNPKATINS